MSPQEIAEIADQASNKDVVWFLVVALLASIIVGTFVGRWIFQQLEKVQRRADESNAAFTDFLKTANVEMVNAITKSNELFSRAIGTMERTSRVLERVEDHLKREDSRAQRD